MGVLSSGLVAAGAAGAAAPAASSTAEVAPPPSCPQPPLPPGTPTPISVTGPTTPPESSGTATITSGSTTGPLGSPGCQWVYDLPSAAGDPTVTFTYLGDQYMALATNYTVDYSDYYGVSCDIKVQVLNGLGGAGAQQTLTSGYCNTDGYVPGESTVQVVNSNDGAGPVETVASFNNTVTSFIGGYDVFFGTFTACSENPVGQHATYNCDYYNGGPLF